MVKLTPIPIGMSFLLTECFGVTSIPTNDDDDDDDDDDNDVGDDDNDNNKNQRQ